MDAVVLCGGMGTRLKSVTGEKPKVLAEISGRPFLSYLFADFKAQKVNRVVLCTGFGSEEVEAYCKKNISGIEWVISQEEKALGTGGAVKLAKKYIKSDPFVVLNGDVFFHIDIQALRIFHLGHNAIATLVTSEVEDTRDFGTIISDDEHRIQRFLEKVPVKQKGHVSVGFYCFSKQLFDLMPVVESFSLERDIFPKLVKENFYALGIDDGFLDIGTPERYKEAQKRFKR